MPDSQNARQEVLRVLRSPAAKRIRFGFRNLLVHAGIFDLVASVLNQNVNAFPDAGQGPPVPILKVEAPVDLPANVGAQYVPENNAIWLRTTSFTTVDD